MKFNLIFTLSSRPGRPPKRHTQIDTENNDKIHAANTETISSPPSTALRNSKSNSAPSNFQQYIGKNGLHVRSVEQPNIPMGPSSMSPYSILTSSSCSSSSLAGSMDHDMNNPSQNIISPSNLMHKFGFLPYAFNKTSIKNPYMSNSFEEPSIYDENLNSINNAAAAYALYGRMLQQQQVPNFENNISRNNQQVLIKSSPDHSESMENRDPSFHLKKAKNRQEVNLLNKK